MKSQRMWTVFPDWPLLSRVVVCSIALPGFSPLLLPNLLQRPIRRAQCRPRGIGFGARKRNRSDGRRGKLPPVCTCRCSIAFVWGSSQGRGDSCQKTFSLVVAVESLKSWCLSLVVGARLKCRSGDTCSTVHHARLRPTRLSTSSGCPNLGGCKA